MTVTTTAGAARPGQLWVLALTSFASFMVVLDMLVVSTALTSIQRSLHASLDGLEWTINAYTLSFAVLLMTAASLGDRYGRRRTFALGLVLFAVFSAACALAPNLGVLIGARVIQGAGAAAIMPAALSLLNGAFPPARRGWALGIYGSVTGLGALLGPVIGGALTQGLGWQWIFWLNVPIAAAIVALLFRKVRETPRAAAKVDLVGLALITIAAFGFVWGLVRGNTAGWSSAEVLTGLIGGAAATVGFVVWERLAPAPMLPLRLFSSRAFSAGNTGIFFLNATMSGAIFLMAQYQQVVLGQDALHAGLRLLPWGIAPFLITPLAGALADRVGARPLAVLGMLVQAGGAIWIAGIAGPETTYIALVLPMALYGIGFALAIPAITRAATSEVSPADLGKASGAYSTMRQLGGAFGIAILGAVFAGAGGAGSAAGSGAGSAAAFSAGFSAALMVGGLLAVVGAVASALLSGRQRGADTPRTLPIGSQGSAAGPVEDAPPLQP